MMTAVCVCPSVCVTKWVTGEVSFNWKKNQTHLDKERNYARLRLCRWCSHAE